MSRRPEGRNNQKKKRKKLKHKTKAEEEEKKKKTIGKISSINKKLKGNPGVSDCPSG